MLSQLCRAQLWPKPSHKWRRNFSRSSRRKPSMDSPNIVHFNCNTNDLHGITDHDDFSCSSSDEENDCSDDSCSDCSSSAPLRKDCCCCCQVAENPAYGLSASQQRQPLLASQRDSAACPGGTACLPATGELSRWRTSSPRDSPLTENEAPLPAELPCSRPISRHSSLASTQLGSSAFRVVVPRRRPAPEVPRRRPRPRRQHSPVGDDRASSPPRASSFDPLSVRVEVDHWPDDDGVVAAMPRHDPVPERVASVTELRRASAKRPAQVAMVVMQCARLHLGLGAPQSLLPMGTLVTALYRDHEWICVQTPHGVRGFVRHTSCAPLGSLAPKPARGRKVLARRAASKMSSVYGGTISAASSVDNLTLRRNMVHHRGNRGRAAEKVLEKNIDKLVWGSAADLPGTKLVATLEALKIEASNGSLNSARQ